MRVNLKPYGKGLAVRGLSFGEPPQVLQHEADVIESAGDPAAVSVRKVSIELTGDRQGLLTGLLSLSESLVVVEKIAQRIVALRQIEAVLVIVRKTVDEFLEGLDGLAKSLLGCAGLLQRVLQLRVLQVGESCFKSHIRIGAVLPEKPRIKPNRIS